MRSVCLFVFQKIKINHLRVTSESFFFFFFNSGKQKKISAYIFFAHSPTLLFCHHSFPFPLVQLKVYTLVTLEESAIFFQLNFKFFTWFHFLFFFFFLLELTYISFFFRDKWLGQIRIRTFSIYSNFFSSFLSFFFFFVSSGKVYRHQ